MTHREEHAAHLKELKRIQAAVRVVAPHWRLNFYDYREEIEQLITDTRNLAAVISSDDSDHDLVRAANSLEEMYWVCLKDLKVDD